ncbi:MAG: MATE family efflux transporter [Pseudomonadota bacterium]
MSNSQTSRFKTGKGDLTQGDLSRHLIRLSLPMTWGIGAIVSFQLVDMYYISQLPRTDHLAAISFTFPVTFALFSIIMGFGIAMSSVVSRLIGAGDDDLVKRVTTHGLILVFGLVGTLATLGYFLQDALFKPMVAKEDHAVILPLIRDYMSIWFAGAVFVSMPLVGNAAIRAGGDTFIPAMIMTIVAVMNVILDPILIFGLFGFPRMELEGAALATVISNAVAMFAGLYVLGVRNKMLCAWNAMHFSKFWDSSKRLLFIALPAGLANSIQPLVNALIISLLAGYGTEAVAAYGIVTRIEAFAFIILMGVAVGMAPIIGQNFGAGNFDRIKTTLKLAIGFSVIWSLFIAVILGSFAKPISQLFENDPKIIEYTTLFFWIVPITYMFSNLIRGWASAFNAMGKPQRSVMMIIGEMVILMIPAIYIGNHLGGVMGIFIAMAIVNVLAGTIFHLWSWNSCRLMEKSRTETSPAPQH